MDIYTAVKEFHKCFNIPYYTDFAAIPAQDRVDLRMRLIAEEHQELQHAVAHFNLTQIADGLADLVYVIFSMALEFGIPLNEVLQEVHRSNMTKLWPDGLPRYRKDGKVLKPLAYSPPNLKPILNRNQGPTNSSGQTASTQQEFNT